MTPDRSGAVMRHWWADCCKCLSGRPESVVDVYRGPGEVGYGDVPRAEAGDMLAPRALPFCEISLREVLK